MQQPDSPSKHLQIHGLRIPSIRAVLDTLTTVALLVAACTVIWSNTFRKTEAGSARRTLSIPDEPISLDTLSRMKGFDSAPTVLFAFSDFECPFCKAFAQKTLPQLEKEYVESGKLRIVFRHMPLPGHAFALSAAKAADCAGEQGQFWKAHDVLFGREDRLDGARIESLRNLVGLNQLAFDGCVAKPAPAIDRDVALAQRLGITGTPSFLIGSVLANQTAKITGTIIGTARIDDFRAAINKAASFRR